MTLSSFLTKFRSCRGKLIKIKQNEKHFVKISVKGLKMTLACWIWTIWKVLTTVAFVGHLLHFLSPAIWPPSVELSFYQVHCSCQNLSCIASVRRTDFVAKYTSMIFIGCCVVNRPVGSILVSKESPRPAVYTTWKIWKKIVKQNFEMKNKIGRFWTTRGWQLAGSFPTSLQ